MSLNSRNCLGTRPIAGSGSLLEDTTDTIPTTPAAGLVKMQGSYSIEDSLREGATDTVPMMPRVNGVQPIGLNSFTTYRPHITRLRSLVYAYCEQLQGKLTVEPWDWLARWQENPQVKIEVDGHGGRQAINVQIASRWDGAKG